MVQSIDKERVMGTIRREKSVVDFFTGAGTGIVVSCLFSPESSVRTAAIVVGIVMVGIGWYKNQRATKRCLRIFSSRIDNRSSFLQAEDTKKNP